MDWESPLWLLAAPPALAWLLWTERGSVHPMGPVRRRWLLLTRGLTVLLVLLALAGPARVRRGEDKALGLVLDASQSLGAEGLQSVLAEARRLRDEMGSGRVPFAVLAGAEPRFLDPAQLEGMGVEAQNWQREHGARTDLAAALEFATALFPAGAARELVLMSDGFETQGDALAQARRFAASGGRLHVLGISGPAVPDVRVLSLEPNRARVREGETVELSAQVETTQEAGVVLRWYENGVEVERRTLALKAGETRVERLQRSPDRRDLFAYRVTLESNVEDALPGNNEAMAVVDARGRMRLLYVDTDSSDGGHLPAAMRLEGMELDWRQPANLPVRLDELAGFDAVVLSEATAAQLRDPFMNLLREYVDKLGGGLVMLGGPSSFGVGGYFKSPLEDLLPVRLRAPDEEEKQSAAVALVLDRSGSMAGEKLEMAKGAAIATAEVLGRNDHIGVYAFDTEAKIITPMTRLTSLTTVAGQISALTAGGGTNLEPAFQAAREALRRVKARVKHMIIMTDGQTAGGGYETVASACRAEGMTISTVALGEGAHAGLLQAIAAAGGGQSYTTLTPDGIIRIFTQDTLMHTGRMLREEPFEPRVAERHPMIEGVDIEKAPPLLGYVKTMRRVSAQTPLLTDAGDPLLAHWRFGLGKVTAFTSDAKSRWGSLWVTRWPDYTRFWSQVLRETARPAQGGRMDLNVETMEGGARLSVDLLEDSGARKNDALVEAEVFRLGLASASGALQSLGRLRLNASGPGLYEGRFLPEEAGVYLVRAQAGSETATAGLVYQKAAEAGWGRVNEPLLRGLARITGGSWLERGETPRLQAQAGRVHEELWPLLAGLALLLAFADLLIRRWEQVAGLLRLS